MSIALLISTGLVFAALVLGLLKLLATLLWIAVLRRALAAGATLLALFAAQLAVNVLVQSFSWVPPTAYYSQAGLLILLWLLFVVPMANVIGWLLKMSAAANSDDWTKIERFGWSGAWDWIFRQTKRDLDDSYVPPRLLVPEIEE